VSGAYEGRQIVGMDLHRRRSVLVRMTEAGEHLAQVMARAGKAPKRQPLEVSRFAEDAPPGLNSRQ